MTTTMAVTGNIIKLEYALRPNRNSTTTRLTKKNVSKGQSIFKTIATTLPKYCGTEVVLLLDLNQIQIILTLAHIRGALLKDFP